MGAGGFGGADAMGGGGFMTNDAEQKPKQASRDKGVILPVTIRQILNQQQGQDEIMVDGLPVSQVCLVATVEAKIEKDTNTTYTVDDGTGKMDIQQFSDRNGAENVSDIPENALVKVHGSAKLHNGRPQVYVYNIQVVTDWNEMTHHMLTTVLTHLQNTKGPIPGTAEASKGSTFGMGAGTGGLSMVPSAGMSLNAAVNPAGGAAGGDLKKAVLATYEELCNTVFTDGSGAGWQPALEHLNKNGHPISMDQLKKTVMHLANEGNMYTTLDEEHYATC